MELKEIKKLWEYQKIVDQLIPLISEVKQKEIMEWYWISGLCIGSFLFGAGSVFVLIWWALP